MPHDHIPPAPCPTASPDPVNPNNRQGHAQQGVPLTPLPPHHFPHPPSLLTCVPLKRTSVPRLTNRPILWGRVSDNLLFVYVPVPPPPPHYHYSGQSRGPTTVLPPRSARQLLCPLLETGVSPWPSPLFCLSHPSSSSFSFFAHLLM